MLGVVVALVLAAPSPGPPQPAAAPDAPALPTVEASWEHDLSTPGGVVRLTWPSLAYDRVNGELFVVGDGFVRIFDATGMEVHRFGDDGSLGQVSRVAVLESGELVVASAVGGRHTFLRCDFRGAPIEPFGLTGLPRELADFDPDQLVHRGGKLYFAERSSMRAIVTDVSGRFLQGFRLRELVTSAMPPDAETRGAPVMDGFNVDARGNLLVTMSTLFAGAVVSPTGQVRLFGSRGSRPGKFNIIGGVDADEAGNVYVTDRLRSVVSVWDPELRHLGEFGYRGDEPDNLLTPYEIAAGNGRVYVAQAGQMGVKVFRVRLVEPPPPPAPGTPAPLGTRPER